MFNKSHFTGQFNSPEYLSKILKQAEKIELMLLDVDGVLTDGTLLYTDSASESKSFHTQDGFGEPEINWQPVKRLLLAVTSVWNRSPIWVMTGLISFFSPVSALR